jgi:tetratricopeptide (TPR) repeat protein
MKNLLSLSVLLLLSVAFNAAATERPASKVSIDSLLYQLKYSQTPLEARLIEQKVWDYWNKDSTNPRARELMFLGIISMEQNELDSALLMFDGVIKHDPGWAEGWSKRATIHFFLNDYLASIKDIKETLDREPRHFGAMNGLGHIFTAMGEEEKAIEIFKTSLTYHPYMRDALVVLNDLEKRKQKRVDELGK